VLAGCRVDTTVTVRMRDDGSGRVAVKAALDAEAVRAVEAGGATLETGVRLGDLPEAGWRVGEWRRDEDGSAAVVLERRFSAPEDVRRVIAEISGADGPLRGVRARRMRAWGGLATDYEVDGRIDLAAVKTGVADDAELVARLTGLDVDVADVDARLRAAIDTALQLEVVVVLPGGERVAVPAEPGASAPLHASSRVLEIWRIGLVAAALVLMVTGVVVWRRPRRRRRSPGAPRGSAGYRDAPRLAR
jgi:hypothetical protein